MKLTPWGSYTLEIAQTSDIVCRRLQHKMAKRWIVAMKNRSKFWGNFEDDRLKICYMGFQEESSFVKKNSFYPYFHGTVTEISGKTKLEFKWRMSVFAMIFMMIWFSGIGFGVFLTLMIGDLTGILITSGMFLAGAVLMIWGLNTGLKDTKAAIRETAIAPGEWWREYEGDEGDEVNV